MGEVVRPRFGGLVGAKCCERGCDKLATRRLDLVELELSYGLMIEGEKCFKVFCDEHFPKETLAAAPDSEKPIEQQPLPLALSNGTYRCPNCGQQIGH